MTRVQERSLIQRTQMPNLERRGYMAEARWLVREWVDAVQHASRTRTQGRWTYTGLQRACTDEELDLVGLGKVQLPVGSSGGE